MRSGRSAVAIVSPRSSFSSKVTPRKSQHEGRVLEWVKVVTSISVKGQPRKACISREKDGFARFGRRRVWGSKSTSAVDFTLLPREIYAQGKHILDVFPVKNFSWI